MPGLMGAVARVTTDVRVGATGARRDSISADRKNGETNGRMITERLPGETLERLLMRGGRNRFSFLKK